MEASGIRFVNHFNTESVQSSSQNRQPANNAAELSGAEESMIQEKFKGRGADLTFYQSSGRVNTENPASKGAHIDFKI